MFPKSTHETFAQKLYQTFKNNKRFIKPKLSRTSFTISHYAGEVNTFGLFHYIPFMIFYIFFNCYLNVFLSSFWLFFLCPGDISSWYVSWQKQGLCGGWTSGSAHSLKMLICGWSIPPFSRGVFKIIEVLFNRISLQGIFNSYHSFLTLL